MKIHEYQAKELFRKYGVSVPFGIAVESVESALKAYQDLGSGTVVVKSQIHAGGRGKGTVHCPNTGDILLEGGVHLAHSKEEVEQFAKTMLNHILITHQTGPAGKEVQKLLIESGVDIKRELYAGIVLDRVDRKFVFMVSTEGGMDIEAVAEKTPEKIITVTIDPSFGFTKENGIEVSNALKLTGNNIDECVELTSNLYRMFVERDMDMLEINPLIVMENGGLKCLDAKMAFDGNALFRQPDILALRDETEEDAKELEASKYDLSYIALDGEIGCMVNGAGLAMATMDIIKLKGAEPANFLDVGGGATAEKVTAAFKIITSDPKVKGILVNIFGGIMRCDVIAEGVVEAVKEVGLTVPLVVRLEGTKVQEGKDIINNSPFDVIAADDLDDAAAKIVKAVKG